MTMRRQVLSLTTDISGNATAVGTNILGKLYAIEYRPGTIATGATVTVTCEADTSRPLLTKSSAGTVNTIYYPRDIMNAVADGAALTATAGGDRCQPIMNGYPKVVIASGGNTLTGSVVIYYEL